MGSRNNFFNPVKPSVMHIDLNSCFASVEQQANPFLRDKPLAVVHSDAPYGCILAPSVEAKLWGVKTGMTLGEGRGLCPFLLSHVADPDKYRFVHSQFARLLSDYSSHLIPKSIDEFVLTIPEGSDPSQISTQIKSRIKSEIGDWLRVSVGVSTNQILAKLASGLHKPDGFDIINHSNFLDIYRSVSLTDLCGINVRNEARLHRVGIFSVPQFYSASSQTLISAFQSVLGRSWHTRLHGYEIDDVEFKRKSFGQSYVLPHSMQINEWRPILAKLVSKAAFRLRAEGYSAQGVHLSIRFDDHTHWHTGHKTASLIFDDATLLTLALSLYQKSSPHKPVKKLAFTCFGISKDNGQLNYLTSSLRQKALVSSLDKLNERWGSYTVVYGSSLGSSGHVRDAISFGK
ncbi:MAG: hypothetical protein ABII80_00320 [bacterium]